MAELGGVNRYRSSEGKLSRCPGFARFTFGEILVLELTDSAVERDNGIAITHTKTQQTKMNVHVNAALTVSVCGHLPMVKCPSGVSGPICHEILSWLSVIGLLDVLPST